MKCHLGISPAVTWSADRRGSGAGIGWRGSDWNDVAFGAKGRCEA